MRAYRHKSKFGKYNSICCENTPVNTCCNTADSSIFEKKAKKHDHSHHHHMHHIMPHMHMGCCMPKIKCTPTKECVKTYKCCYKLYKFTQYRLYKVCDYCNHEYDHYYYKGMCPKCR
ncbi:hypothetical protein LJC10_00830 [Selenomonadales bacterium OttesenSCG-928-I06]|nr:hypothetical protein [Selenomonadales bacterium OttesenSCG-928-I06]